MWRVTPHTSPSEVSRINVNKNFSHVPPKVILKTQYCVTKNFSDALILIIYAKRIQYTVMPCVVNLFPSIPYKGLQKILRGKEECYCHLIWDNSVLTKRQVGKQSQPAQKVAECVWNLELWHSNPHHYHLSYQAFMFCNGCYYIIYILLV